MEHFIPVKAQQDPRHIPENPDLPGPRDLSQPTPNPNKVPSDPKKKNELVQAKAWLLRGI